MGTASGSRRDSRPATRPASARSALSEAAGEQPVVTAGGNRGRSRAARAVAVLMLVGAAAACAGPDLASNPATSPPASSSGGGHGDTDQHSGAPQAAALPSGHVHAVAVNPADRRVYLATHDGLFRYDRTGPARVGPIVDLMGFTIAGPDHFYASGHPGPGVDLPQPVGLIESIDAGRSWTPLSRQGESDFHALAASQTGVVGFDGTLRSTQDGTNWRDLPVPAAPHALAASPDGQVLLGTSETGLIRSTDAGHTWAFVDRAPLLMLIDWSDAATVVGITPDGTVATSDDAGLTWTNRGNAGGTPQALGAHPTGRTDPGGIDVLVVTDTTLLRSSDGGVTFAAVTHGT